METGRERLSPKLKFPLIVKPNQEGSSKGVSAQASVVDDEDGLRAVVRELIDRYRQPALIEDYIPGREFTVGLLGDRRPRVLPPMEILFKDKDNPRPVYDFQIKQEWEKHVCYQCPADLTPGRAEGGRARLPRDLRGARLPRRRPRRPAHDAQGRDLRHRGQPAARADARLLGPLPHRQGRGHRLPHADRRDPRGRASSDCARSAARRRRRGSKPSVEAKPEAKPDAKPEPRAAAPSQVSCARPEMAPPRPATATGDRDRRRHRHRPAGPPTPPTPRPQRGMMRRASARPGLRRRPLPGRAAQRHHRRRRRARRAHHPDLGRGAAGRRQGSRAHRRHRGAPARRHLRATGCWPAASCSTARARSRG